MKSRAALPMFRLKLYRGLVYNKVVKNKGKGKQTNAQGNTYLFFYG